MIYKSIEMTSRLEECPKWFQNFWFSCKNIFLDPKEVLWAYNIEIISIERINGVSSRMALNFYNKDDYVEFCLKWM